MSYAVKEAFLTLQGEGVQAGSRAVFLRFAGCNLWSGREQDRATAQCNFCDTDFVGTDGPGGGKFASAAGAVIGSVVSLALGRPEPWSVSLLLVALTAGLIQAAFIAIYTAMLTRITAQLTCGQPGVPDVKQAE